MGQHDEYGKAVLKRALGEDFSDYSPRVSFSYCEGSTARVDGVVGSQIAVEIESRVPKQIRGALMDLICHPHPKKLLVLLPVHMSNPIVTQRHCESILRRFVAAGDFSVVLLTGNGNESAFSEDIVLVKKTVEVLLRGSDAKAQSMAQEASAS